MKEKELSHHEILNKWIDLDSMIPKKCSDAHTMWKKSSKKKTFAKNRGKSKCALKTKKRAFYSRNITICGKKDIKTRILVNRLKLREALKMAERSEA